MLRATLEVSLCLEPKNFAHNNLIFLIIRRNDFIKFDLQGHRIQNKGISAQICLLLVSLDKDNLLQ